MNLFLTMTDTVASQNIDFFLINQAIYIITKLML